MQKAETVKAEQTKINFEAPFYQQMYPVFYAPKKNGAIEIADKTAYITFDDGPSARTDEILATLTEKGVKETFFVVTYDSENLERVKKIVAQGHSIGILSYSYIYSQIYASLEVFFEDMYSIFNLEKQTTGVTPPCCSSSPERASTSITAESITILS